jgi:hypothetical protein
MTTTARPTSTKTPLNPGESRTHKAGNAAITISRGVDCYSITVQQGVARVDEWCGTYPTETEMRDAYLHTYRAFYAHGTAQGIEARRNQLACERQQTQTRLDRSRNPEARAAYAATIAALDTEMDALRDLHTIRRTPDLITHVTAFLAA